MGQPEALTESLPVSPVSGYAHNTMLFHATSRIHLKVQRQRHCENLSWADVECVLQEELPRSFQAAVHLQKVLGCGLAQAYRNGDIGLPMKAYKSTGALQAGVVILQGTGHLPVSPKAAL